MVELRVGPLRDVVDVVRSFVTDWDAFIRQVDTLTREHEQLRGRSEWLEKQLTDLQEAHERLRREHDEASQALNDLRSAHQTLLREHEEGSRAHHELRERYDALERSRIDAAGELEALLRRLKP
jgi:DNA repair exonuclease SbcCD ATPase subunit